MSHSHQAFIKLPQNCETNTSGSAQIVHDRYSFWLLSRTNNLDSHLIFGYFVTLIAPLTHMAFYRSHSCIHIALVRAQRTVTAYDILQKLVSKYNLAKYRESITSISIPRCSVHNTNSSPLPPTEWSPFCRRYIQMHFSKWEVLYLD